MSHYGRVKYNRIGYHIRRYHIISHYIISYHIISYSIISHHIILVDIISNLIISHHIILCHIMSYHIISYHIMLFHITTQLLLNIVFEPISSFIIWIQYYHISSSISYYFICLPLHRPLIYQSIFHTTLPFLSLLPTSQSGGRQFPARKKSGDVFSEVLGSDSRPIICELEAVKRAIACVYLAIPVGAVQMAASTL